MQVDGFLMQGGEGRGEGDFGDDGGLAGNIDHDEVIAGDGAQAGGIGGVANRRSNARRRRNGGGSRALRGSRAEGGVVRTEFLAILDGQLEGGAFQVGQQDFQIVGIDVGVFGRTAEEVIGMLDDVLIERRAGGDQDRGGCGLAPSGAAGALPG